MSPSQVSEGVWTSVVVEPAAITEVIPGDDIPGFRTTTAFDGRWDAILPNVAILASAARQSHGDSLRPANLSFTLDELREGAIAYKREDGAPMAFASSAADFQATLAPDCAAG